MPDAPANSSVALAIFRISNNSSPVPQQVGNNCLQHLEEEQQASKYRSSADAVEEEFVVPDAP